MTNKMIRMLNTWITGFNPAWYLDICPRFSPLCCPL